jgi:hypothetical protein
MITYVLTGAVVYTCPMSLPLLFPVSMHRI